MTQLRKSVRDTKRHIGSPVQAFTLQPQYTFDLGEAAELISSNVIDVQRTCSGALEGLEAAHSSTSFQGLAGEKSAQKVH